MSRCRIFAGVLLALLACLAPVRAQEQGSADGTLHVLRPLIHAEQEEAEICLEFDRDLDTADRRRAASSVRLESGGKNSPVAAHNISIAGDLLCLSTLEHRREYRLVITGLRGAKGEKLATPYSLAFTVPDRQPSLAFSGNAYAGGLMRWQDSDPVLRAVNVPRVGLELIRITDPALMTEAWRERRQTALAPSESAAFARDHGQTVWSGDLTLDDVPNKAIEQKTPLHDMTGNLPSGLYLIVARAPEAKTETKTVAAGNLAATSAVWLLRSALRLHAVHDVKGFYALAETPNGSSAVKDAHLTVEDPNGQKIAEAKTDADGVAFLPLGDDKQGVAAILAGFTDAGDADFTDLTTQTTNRFILPGNEMTLTPDKPFYPPGGTVSVVLAAHDIGGRPIPESGTSLQLLWPGGGVYANFPLSPDANGVTRLSFPAPAANAIWSLAWQASDGKTLTQAPLRVTSNINAPHIETSADRALLPIDGEVNLTLKSLTNEGRPSPYVTGRVLATWTVPDHIFQEWKDYHFGNDTHPGGDAAPVASFVTDEKGVVLIHLNLAPPDDHAALHSVVLSVRGDAGGIADPAPLTLPLKSKEAIVGIRPLAPGGRFPENSLARFNIVALDTDGHRQPVDDLTYQIYEGGRSFDWYQAEGRWNYKPEQQNRRIAGGTVESGTGAEGLIEWPAAAGSYRLEITDANGAVRAATEFSAGWELPESLPLALSLGLTPTAPLLQPGQEMHIRFTLDQPSMVSVFIGDDHIRKVIHQPMPKGEDSVAFTPEKDWGGRIGLRLEADNLNLAGQITLPLLREGQTAPVLPKETDAPQALSIDTQIPSILRVGDSAHIAFDLRNNSKTIAVYRASATVSPDLKITGVIGNSISLAPGQSKSLLLTLTALHPGAATFRLDVTGPSHFRESRDGSIPVLPDETGFSLSSQQKIEPQKLWTAPIEKPHAKSESGMLFLSPAPLFSAPLFLAEALQAHPFATREITGLMETFRLWRDAIIAAGLQPEAALDMHRRDLLLRLLARQNPDGGFPVAPEDISDLASTAEGLSALAHADEEVAKPATDLATGWLKHRLENTWFDERERPLRAAAYAALAEANRLDGASLHYFGDTSVDKALPPLAAAQLALAFAKSNDPDKASFWLDASGARKNPSDIPESLLPVLAANSFFDPQSMTQAMEKSAEDLIKDTSRDIESLNSFLRAVWFMQHRKGAWRVTIGTDKRNPKDVLVLPLPERNPIPTVHNTNDGPIFLVRAQEMPVPSQGLIVRHVYQLNGTEAGGRAPLEWDQTYLVILEGSWGGDASDALLVHDDPSPALQPAECLPPSPIEADDELAWLKSQTLTPLSKCEIGGDGISMLTVPRENSAPSWRIAYLAKAEWAGTFSLAPASARNAGESRDIMRGEKTQVDVR